MTVCQRCGSIRILSASGKSDDKNSFCVSGKELESQYYVIRGCNIGGGDYYHFSVCLNCGQMQGDWPVQILQEELDEE